MQLNFKVIDKTLVISFNGELDHHMADEVRTKIDSYYVEKSLKNIVFDLKGLNFMDSAGIGLIMGRYKIASQNGGKIYLINASSRVKKILNMSGMMKIVKIYDSLNDALDNL
ncbi:anti-sigma F factor antagonist [Caldisalinibacter kiritimatiensis]|uniref:Anti-sigma F factor antagonist n=1 Tax=Caldisalinibacter kiritimatiensis TaxID=1304284 RepID=R1AXY7_9FIRM|nr:anti-sigma F factor antagonist [Caldisalinibacter kiritimatiensis]EOD01507.1 anti-sigma F factor antagonist (spoIIAA-2) / anti sigma b factor antagonist RsbV [Caldisalinibacter kiritimatiensis]